MSYFNITQSGLPRRMAVALAILASVAVSAATHLILEFSDGSTTGFVVSDKPHLSFSDTHLHVRSANVTSDYLLSEVSKFTFGDMTALETPAASGEVRFEYVDTDRLCGSGLRAGETVSLFTVGGQVALTVAASADGNLQIDLSQLPSGIYVVACNSSKNFKIKH